MKILLIVLLGFISMNPLAYASDNTWFTTGAFGMSTYSNLSDTQNKNAIARLSLGKVFFTEAFIQLSLEAGIQSGSTQRLSMSGTDIDLLGGVPIELQFRPQLDFLLGMKSPIFNDGPWFASVKGGMAYRQMQTDRVEVNDVSRFSPKLEVGVGYKINDKASVSLSYQYIWGKKPTLVVDSFSETGVLRNIPSQQALLVGFCFNF